MFIFSLLNTTKTWQICTVLCPFQKSLHKWQLAKNILRIHTLKYSEAFPDIHHIFQKLKSRNFLKDKILYCQIASNFAGKCIYKNKDLKISQSLFGIVWDFEFFRRLIGSWSRGKSSVQFFVDFLGICSSPKHFNTIPNIVRDIIFVDAISIQSKNKRLHPSKRARWPFKSAG